MSAKMTAGPAEMSVTLEDARTAARVNGTDNDADISIQVDALTADAEHKIGQVIINRTYEIKLSDFPSSIDAPALPLYSVLEVLYFNAEGAELTLDSAAYRIDEDSVPPCLVPADDTEWPETQVRWDAVRVRVVCGYGPTSVSTPPAFKGYILGKIKEYFAPAGTPESPFLVRLLDSLKAYS